MCAAVTSCGLAPRACRGSVQSIAGGQAARRTCSTGTLQRGGTPGRAGRRASPSPQSTHVSRRKTTPACAASTVGPSKANRRNACHGGGGADCEGTVIPRVAPRRVDDCLSEVNPVLDDLNAASLLVEEPLRQLLASLSKGSDFGVPSCLYLLSAFVEGVLSSLEELRRLLDQSCSAGDRNAAISWLAETRDELGRCGYFAGRSLVDFTASNENNEVGGRVQPIQERLHETSNRTGCGRQCLACTSEASHEAEVALLRSELRDAEFRTSIATEQGRAERRHWCQALEDIMQRSIEQLGVTEQKHLEGTLESISLCRVAVGELNEHAGAFRLLSGLCMKSGALRDAEIRDFEDHAEVVAAKMNCVEKQLEAEEVKAAADNVRYESLNRRIFAELAQERAAVMEKDEMYQFRTSEVRRDCRLKEEAMESEVVAVTTEMYTAEKHCETERRKAAADRESLEELRRLSTELRQEERTHKHDKELYQKRISELRQDCRANEELMALSEERASADLAYERRQRTGVTMQLNEALDSMSTKDGTINDLRRSLSVSQSHDQQQSKSVDQQISSVPPLPCGGSDGRNTHATTNLGIPQVADMATALRDGADSVCRISTGSMQGSASGVWGALRYGTPASGLGDFLPQQASSNVASSVRRSVASVNSSPAKPMPALMASTPLRGGHGDACSATIDSRPWEMSPADFLARWRLSHSLTTPTRDVSAAQVGAPGEQQNKGMSSGTLRVTASLE
eukprot:TRINITY_DN22352_c0_g1_i1.p1 TRINITY_DN22352_c0_g1~~TRINITY_DN22352_c0_g1_i1.p1  ORF type:complete len:741 (+),score=103.56 TRINITY_DN22352_c0_g1_i1:29-2251(+)